MADASQPPARRAPSRVPPHNLSAEESVLGAMLLRPDAIAAAIELISADDFYKPTHAHVFDAVSTLYGQGQAVDPVTVSEELRRAGLLEAVGGQEFLLELQNTTPAVSSAAHYARIVEENALLRRLIRVAGDIAEMGYELPDDVAKAIDRAESMVFDVAQRRVVDSTKSLHELLGGTLDHLEKLFERGEAITGLPTGYTDLDELLSGLQPSTLNIVGARPSMGKCVAATTVVLDPATGALPTAAELAARAAAGRPISVAALDADGQIVPVTPSAVVDDGVKPVYRVVTRSGRTVLTTAEHPFLTELGWRPLVEIELGARIAVPGALPFFGDRALPSGEVLLLAQVLATAGLRGDARAQCAAIAERAAQLGIDAIAVLRRHGLWHADPLEQDLPAAVARLPRAQLVVFLQRFVAANRAIQTGGDLERLMVPSPRLARGLAHLLLRFGIVADVATASSERAATCVLVKAGSVERYRELLQPAALARAGGPSGAPAHVDPPHAAAAEAVVWDEVTEITFAGRTQVYDLTVPGLHNFVAADVVVHNTAFALGMASHAAVESNKPVLFFSLEMGHHELTQRILASEARVDSQKMRTGRLTEQDWSKIIKALGRLEAPLWIDDNPNLTVMEIRAKARRLKSRIGELGLIVIDYLQLMSGSGSRSAENRQVEVSEISRGLKILARELRVPVVALSQLSRGLEARADKRPMLADLRESGCLVGSTPVALADGSFVSIGELAAMGARDVAVLTLDERLRIVPGRMLKAFPSGTKPCFRMRLRSGREIEASGNHPFLTIDGWRRLDQLTRGDHVAIDRSRVRAWHGTPCDLIPAEVCEYLERKHDHTLADGARPLTRAEVGELAVLYDDQWLADLASSDVTWDQVRSIVATGERTVFDATVEGTHNFVANGMVVHNSIEQDADVVMFIYRDEHYNPESSDVGVAEIIVAKHRNGPTGTRKLAFIGTYTKFANMARGM